MLMIMIHILNLSNMNTNKNFRIGMIQCFIFATRVKRCQECVGQLNSIFLFGMMGQMPKTGHCLWTCDGMGVAVAITNP